MSLCCSLLGSGVMLFNKRCQLRDKDGWRVKVRDINKGSRVFFLESNEKKNYKAGENIFVRIPLRGFDLVLKLNKRIADETTKCQNIF